MANDAAVAAAIYTIDKYIKGVDDNVSIELPEIYWFKEKSKNFRYNQHGPGVRWLPRLTRGTVEGFAREKRLTVVRTNRTQQALLNNRGYGMGEMLHWTDLQENGTPELIADLLSDTLEAMEGDMFYAQGNGVYDDGTDTTYDGLGFQGFKSFCITTGSYAGISVDTYANWKSASSLTLVAPYNQFSSEPFVALDAAITAVRKGGGAEAGRSVKKPDLGFLNWNDFNNAKATLVRRYHFTLPQNAQVQAFGDLEHFVYGGVTWFPSFICPQGELYCFVSEDILFEFPTSKHINEFRQEEGIPRAIYALLITYGRIRCKSPRHTGRFLIA